MRNKVIVLVSNFIHLLLWISCFFFFIGTFITFINVIVRKISSKSWTGMEDFNAIMLMTLVYLPLVYLEWNDKHLSLSLFYEKFPKPVQIIIKKLEHFVIFIFSLFILKGSWEVVTLNYEMGTKLASLQIPVYIPYSVLLIGFGIISLIKILQLIIPVHGGENYDH